MNRRTMLQHHFDLLGRRRDGVFNQSPPVDLALIPVAEMAIDMIVRWRYDIYEVEDIDAPIIFGPSGRGMTARDIADMLQLWDFVEAEVKP
jgi:hypothetical protein